MLSLSIFRFHNNMTGYSAFITISAVAAIVTAVEKSNDHAPRFSLPHCVTVTLDYRPTSIHDHAQATESRMQNETTNPENIRSSRDGRERRRRRSAVERLFPEVSGAISIARLVFPLQWRCAITIVIRNASRLQRRARRQSLVESALREIASRRDRIKNSGVYHGGGGGGGGVEPGLRGEYPWVDNSFEWLLTVMGPPSCTK